MDDPLGHFFQRVFYGFLGSLSLYIATWHNFGLLRDQWTSNPINYVDTYDFIVVGGGTAGSVVANRLSENFRVLLLEAGGDPYPLSSVPGLSLFLLNHNEIDWMHKTVPQKNACLGLKNNESIWSQGKGLGGTSNLNFMVHTRGHPQDFNRWAEITNDPSWSYEGVLPYFKRAEDYVGSWNESAEHARGGPMHIAPPPFVGTSPLFVKAGKDLGYDMVDVNGKFNEGFDFISYNIKFGRRHGAFQAYLRPISRRRSLTVVKFANVHKVLFREDNDKNEAYGVEFTRHDIKRCAYATKEIILSAGTVQTPKILMLSGIGPKEHLETNNVSVRVDSPVGQNVQDHVSTYLGPFFVDDLIVPSFDQNLNGKAFTDYLNRGSGPFTTSGIQATGFVASGHAKARGEGNWPDIQLLYMGMGVHDTFGKDLAKAFNLRHDDIVKYLRHAIGRNSFMIVTSLARPSQRGEIKLTSNDSSSPVAIDPKYLQSPEDVKILIEGLKKAVELVEGTPTFQKYNGRFTNETLPGCVGVPFRSDEYWECYVRHMTLSLHNMVGSSSMGNRGARESVVDPELQVIGTKRLRVVDASVMPTIPIGNTHAPTVMIAERGAQLIKKVWIRPGNSTGGIGSGSSTVASVDIDLSASSSTGAPSEDSPVLNKTETKIENSTTSGSNEIKYRPPLQCKYGYCITE
ncbi:unnamed protein product [Allacma fusca]|uniref:Glucose-methanol-choline oxidoreductase N-terminal domain-containing protein n=1 Tax=Allacma fusca TaxID=39272 RepID=A0A8J2JGC1_9HEXA|nr:unnamed protein product [Allacma fusca]